MRLNLHSRSDTRRRGFTLIELVITVGIIGLLSAIAIPNFLRYQLKAKTSEGKTNLAAIRVVQTTYYAENNVYVSATVSPNQAPNHNRYAFVPSAGFTTLGWAPEGAVYFTYAVAVGGGGREFHASAHANIDGEGAAQLWHYRRGSIDGETHVGVAPTVCPGAFGIAQQVEPCDATSGLTTF